jgi:hypothetical protein
VVINMSRRGTRPPTSNIQQRLRRETMPHWVLDVGCSMLDVFLRFGSCGGGSADSRESGAVGPNARTRLSSLIGFGWRQAGPLREGIFAASVSLLSLLLFASPFSTEAAQNGVELLDVRKIWDRAPHNAFTDLVRFKGRWFCVFREGQAHVSFDGALRVITSKNGRDWTSTALLTSADGDLRDAKITVTPDHRLMLSGAAALRQPSEFKHQSLAWFSADGRTWNEPVTIGDPNLWLWRVTWHKGTAYGIAYDTAGERFIRLYTSTDGKRFQALVPELFNEGQPNETSILFQPDDTALCLLRRDGSPGSGKLGLARPPYTNWQWRDLGAKIGGPHMIRLADGRIVAAVRLYDGGVRTALAWLDPDAGTLTEFLRLPSSGDTSYAGLAWYKDLLWVSYYSSHEGKTCIYLAKVKITSPTPRPAR